MTMLRDAKRRAKKNCVEFNLEKEDLKLPKKCPILGMELGWGEGRSQDNSYSLDRIDSNKGYIKGNVQIVSWRANSLKKNGTLQEFKKLVKWMEKHDKKSF